MSDILDHKRIEGGPSEGVGKNLQSMTFDQKQRLVSAFAWLIEEDKKQNPELYEDENCPLCSSNV